MAAAPPFAQPFTPPPAQGTPLGTGPGLSPEAFATGREKLSQSAGKIQTIDQLNAAIRSQPGSNQLSEQQYKDLVKTWSDTRQTHEQPTQIAAAPPAPGGAPAPNAQQPMGTAVNNMAAPPPVMANVPPANPNAPAGPVANYGAPQQVAQHPQATGAVPPPSPETPPQYTMPTTPVPQYTPPTFTPAQYKPPNKGLEYAMMALNLLFPGAPIARAAAGFAQGLQHGAEQKYQRAEKTAEQQYGAEKDKAQAGFENAKEAYNAAQAKAQADFQNAQVRFAYAQQQRAQGIDPTTGKPMVFPPVQSLLPKSIDPKTKKPVVDQSAKGYAQAYDLLAQQAMQRGATGLAAQYRQDAVTYGTQARAEFVQSQENARTAATINARLTAAVMGENAAQGRENQRENFDLALAGARDRANANRQELQGYRTQAQGYFNTFRTQWTKDFLTPGGKDAKGNPIQPPLSGQQATMHALMRRIDRTDDPYGAAQWMSQFYADPHISDLILTYGQAKEAARQAQGFKIGSFQPPANISGVPKDVKERIDALGGNIANTFYQQVLGGMSLKQIQDDVSAHAPPEIRDQILGAITGKKAEQSTPQAPTIPDAVGLGIGQ